MEEKKPRHKEAKDPDRAINIGELIDGRWEVIRMLGEGGFGAVYEVRDTRGPASSDTFAMKVEANKAAEQVLKMDVNILKRLQERQSSHFVRLVDVGKTDRVHFMITTLVGENLHKLKQRRRGKFKFRTMAHIAINRLEALREMHEIGYLHRDMKPANIAVGRAPCLRDLYLLDFGLCRMYKHSDGRLRRPRDKAGFRGTMRYAPLACHKHQETSRADDLWNWLYVMIESTAGSLPWDQEMTRMREAEKAHQVPMKDVVKLVGDLKERFNNSPTELLDNCPIEYMTLYEHIKSLGFQSDPDYDLMLNALRQMEERRRQADKDGENLDWEEAPGPRTCHRAKPRRHRAKSEHHKHPRP